MTTSVEIDPLLIELAPVVERIHSQQFEKNKVAPWYPTDYIPYEKAAIYHAADQSELPQIPDHLKSATYVNLLTEDNLPYYYEDIHRMFGTVREWEKWNRFWVSIEARHSILLREGAHVLNLVDPKMLEDARREQMAGGIVPKPELVEDGLVYVALQEKATRISHWNTAVQFEPYVPEYSDGTKRVAADENDHYIFYSDVVEAGLEIDPSRFVIALGKILRSEKGFQMPGTGIKDYSKHSLLIASAGIYGFTEIVEKILRPVIFKNWKISTLSGLTPEAEQDQAVIINYFDAPQVKHALEKEMLRRERFQAKLAA